MPTEMSCPTFSSSDIRASSLLAHSSAAGEGSGLKGAVLCSGLAGTSCRPSRGKTHTGTSRKNKTTTDRKRLDLIIETPNILVFGHSCGRKLISHLGGSRSKCKAG